MFKFFKFRLLGGAQSLAPVVKGANNTKFVLERLIAVKLEILVCVSRFSIHRKGEFPCSVSLGFGVEHRDGLVPFILSGEFDGSIYRVDVDGEWFDEVLIEGHDGVIYVSSPYGDLMRESV